MAILKKSNFRLIDIGANLSDPMFKGIYNGKQAHPSDLSQVLNRSFQAGIDKIIITGGSASESFEALKLAQTNERLFSTVGVHPTRCQEFVDPSTNETEYFSKLRNCLKEGKDKVVAIGEFGLDYDRTQFCSPELQKTYFEKQFILAEESKLPLFLHMRNAASDFVSILQKNRHRFTQGVVHSFTGTLQEAKQILDLDLYIGLNGCSLKTPENLQVVQNLPAERMMLETDAPWCSIKTHPAIQSKWPTKDKKKWEEGSCVKGRNEPCFILQVLEVIAATKNMSTEELASITYQNTLKVFFPNSS